MSATSTLAFPIESLAQAIEREENVNPSYNNPGAITSGGSLVQFPSLEAGQTALQNQLQRAVSGQSPYYNPNESLEQFEETYTGGDMNAGTNVASFLGVPSTTPLSSFSAQNNSTSMATPDTSTSTLQSLLDKLKNYETSTGAAKTASSVFGLSVGFVDIVVILVGLILIAGSVFGFKQLQTTVVDGARAGANLSA